MVIIREERLSLDHFSTAKNKSHEWISEVNEAIGLIDFNTFYYYSRKQENNKHNYWYKNN